MEPGSLCNNFVPGALMRTWAHTSQRRVVFFLRTDRSALSWFLLFLHLIRSQTQKANKFGKQLFLKKNIFHLVHIHSFSAQWRQRIVVVSMLLCLLVGLHGRAINLWIGPLLETSQTDLPNKP